MCRLYHNKKSGDYVRLCYRFGSKRGQHVPVNELTSMRIKWCVINRRVINRRVDSIHADISRKNRDVVVRCRFCKSPMSHHAKEGDVCEDCRKMVQK